MDPILLQKQVRDNAEDLQNCLKELKNWETEMKRKENELSSENSSRLSHSTNRPPDTPPLRNKQRKTEKTKLKDDNRRSIDEKHNKIAGFDYASWDKFDADKACAELDAGLEESESEEDTESEEDVETQRQREEAMYEKERGNQFVKNQKWKNAIECYTRAIKCYAYDAIFYANRALCYLKISDLKAAEADCTSALNLDISYVKAFHRRATARIGMDLLEEAKSDLEKVLMLEPKNSVAKSELVKLEEKMAEKNGKAKKMNEKNIEKEAVIKQKKTLETVKPKLLVSQSVSPNIQELNSTDGLTLGSSTNVSSSEKDNARRHTQSSQEIKPKVSSQCVEITESDGEIIHPIHKPPHLRSKKPLTEVDIKVLNKGMPKEPVDLSGFMTNTRILEVQTSDSQQDAPEKEVAKEVPKNTTTANKQKTMPISVPKVEDSSIPPPANTYVDFYVAWRRLYQNVQRRFLYLKQIPAEALPKIFGESLESAVLSEMIETLETGFLPSKEPVYPYLLGISNCKRLSTLSLFMNNADKERLRILLNTCENLGECTKTEADELRKKYEL